MDIYLQIADDINKGISDILTAVSTRDKKYNQTDVKYITYIKWSLVESDIHAHVVKCLTGEKE